MAEELKHYKVAVVSLWPGTVKTEKSYDWLRSGMLSKLTKIPQVFNFILQYKSYFFVFLIIHMYLIKNLFYFFSVLALALVYVNFFLVTFHLNVISCFEKQCLKSFTIKRTLHAY